VSTALVQGLRGKIDGLTLRQQIQALDLTLKERVKERLPASLTTLMHPYKPGDTSWVKPHWRGPFVVLFTSTAVKVAEIVPWIHHSQVKPASLRECIPDPVSPYKITFKTLAPFPTGPCFPEDNRKARIMRHQPCSSHSGS
jgi:hypothetical protein